MTILEGRVHWAYNYELENKKKWVKYISGLFSFVSPLHQHTGYAVLTDRILYVCGDKNVTIELQSIEEVYLGFDEIFPASSAKNFGLFWQPLRIRFGGNQVIYAVMDYNGINSSNQLWFDSLKSMLD
ncbi:MAG: hypothetical protein P0Y49_09680 [Candidatus Pedobacter colombiensis]|uniref:Uncharacterized protein n=1 Tax=Candidatus Pedobacter colombiensis TaxID=3121371 RepID=A0AAJ6BAM7_9SPHI|nr:hypothetical protein [Pedobacter sp.]WEK21408.1 MAG: hypothetical protein P0Y49_09680 [Pedobacter sp.]